MRARSYVGDTTMPHACGHAGPFKVPRAARYFCLRACPHMRDHGTWKCQSCWLTRIITHVKSKPTWELCHRKVTSAHKALLPFGHSEICQVIKPLLLLCPLTLNKKWDTSNAQEGVTKIAHRP